MKIGVVFNLSYSNDIKEILDNNSSWLEIVQTFAPKGNRFEIRCWPDEHEAMDTGKKFGGKKENPQTDEVVFEGPITESFLNHLNGNFLDQHGGIKWFTLNIYQDEEWIFHSGHYGTELVIYVETDEEARQWVDWSKNYPTITCVDVHKF